MRDEPRMRAKKKLMIKMKLEKKKICLLKLKKDM